MAQRITVIARITAKPDKIEQTKQVLLGLLAPTRQEEGCINYDLHQNPDDARSFVFYENWTSRQALDQHLETPHLLDFKAQFDEILSEEIDLSIWHGLDL